ncbi:DNA-binding XRE family transcriptional regulator [Stackebrandtia albiflava]|uniref:DNA-binding XRE family transcriptional regulator n=1 Tax=Stackebrandtia albiflava TaxID=406432 RepID=A0A562V435_9ACTN|nr:helix-turn-helix transcriptional regulator [Stackebrandtia albiflava]TWJ12659.1 DNA-binding XRE family transcriptional regulator [Stackebrandtia albiflava]
MDPAPPFISKRALGDLLQRLRGEAAMSVAEAASELDVDRDTVRRWETGAHVPKKSALEHLGRLYGASADEVRHLVKLSRDSKRPGLWEGADVPQQMRQLYESEPAAESIQTLELALIPGLLQTPEYHLASQEVELVLPPERAGSARRVRERRQSEVFGLESPPKMTFIMAAAALQNLSNHPGVGPGQVARLREVNAMERAEVLVLHGCLHAGMVGSFTIVHPPEGLARPFVYVESVDGGRYVEDRDVVFSYTRTFDLVRASAIPLEEYLT